MEPVTIGILAVAALLVLIALRVQIGVSLILVSFLGLWAIAGLRPAMSMISTIPYSSTASWTLSSIPMFLLMGYVAYYSGLTRGLFEAARLWWGWMPGGLAIASLVGASGFAAVSGSSVACSAAIGRIAVPEMARAGYDLRIATGSVAAGGMRWTARTAPTARSCCGRAMPCPNRCPGPGSGCTCGPNARPIAWRWPSGRGRAGAT